MKVLFGEKKQKFVPAVVSDGECSFMTWNLVFGCNRMQPKMR